MISQLVPNKSKNSSNIFYIFLVTQNSLTQSPERMIRKGKSYHEISPKEEKGGDGGGGRVLG